jgi:hypothetical protein
VTIAVRNPEQGEAARDSITAATGNRRVGVRRLDLVDLASVCTRRRRWPVTPGWSR